MLLLNNTSSEIRLITAVAATVDVLVNFIDRDSSSETPDVQSTEISTATTTGICTSVPSGKARVVRAISIKNISATTTQTVTVIHYNGTLSIEILSSELLPGESLMFSNTGEWSRYTSKFVQYAGAESRNDTSAYGIGGTISETIPRNIIAGANLSALTSGTLSLHAIYLRKGQVVSNISFCSATTAAGTPTNCFFALYDTAARALLGQTANMLTEAWAANTVKTRALTTAYTIPADGLYYVGIMITATTVPTMQGQTAKTSTVLANLATILNGNSTTGLTTTLPNPAAAVTVTANYLWAAIT